MKLENPGYRLNQRLDKGTISSSFEWKIRLQLSQGYHTGILTFLSIVIVIIRKSGILKTKGTIRNIEFERRVYLLCIWGVDTAEKRVICVWYQTDTSIVHALVKAFESNWPTTISCTRSVKRHGTKKSNMLLWTYRPGHVKNTQYRIRNLYSNPQRI